MVARIHFLVPFRSNLDYLAATLKSIVDQSIDDWRATVFDDSTRVDEVQSLVHSFDDARLTLVNNPTPLGIGGNWNAALAAAEAEFACLVHADDLLAPSYAGAVLDLHRQFPGTYGVFTGVRVIDEAGRKKHFSVPDLAKRVLHPLLRDECVIEGDKGLRSLLRGDFIFCPTVTYSVARLRHPVFDEGLRMSLDLLSFAEVLMRGERFVGTTHPHYLYRRHGASTTSTLNADSSRFVEELRIYRLIADSAERVSFHGSARAGRRAAIVKAHILYTALISALRADFGRSRLLTAMLTS